jgi:dihydrofolate synthase/folylpolyglutamate synthase
LWLPPPSLAGVHQIDNAGLATVAALELREAALDEAALGRGLREAEWPARLQRLRRGPMVDLVPDGVAVWLDGGHNPGAGAVLADSLRAAARRRPLHLVVGMLANKDLAQFLAPLLPIAASVRFVPVPDEALSREPGESAALARSLGAAGVGTAASAVGAVAAIAEGEEAHAAPYDVLVCGSLYLAGHVLREHG